MSELKARIERLGPLRVAWVRAYGHSPEEDALRRLTAWAEPAGLLGDPEAHPVFGSNNPSPASGASEYGYELWIAIDSDTQPSEGVAVKGFPGGLYAVTSCQLPEVPRTWQALLRWVQASPHTWRRTTHELERLRSPLAPPSEMVLDLYLPLEG
jgi:DNA gyrase inhibitor GyrI